jgi:hypothetical protein
VVLRYLSKNRSTVSPVASLAALLAITLFRELSRELEKATGNKHTVLFPNHSRRDRSLDWKRWEFPRRRQPTGHKTCSSRILERAAMQDSGSMDVRSPLPYPAGIPRVER